MTTYGLAVRDIAELASVQWQTVVLDEAQAVKNPHTHAARTVRKLPALQKLALTGTPVENRLSELWAILDVVNPGLLGSEHRFRTHWAQPIERDGDVEVAARLRRLTGPFVLRRTKADRSLVPDLPDKVEQIAWATLTREQAAMYQAVVDRLLADAQAEVGMKRRGLVLAALTRLKQICNHPAHAAKDGSRLAGRSGKLARFDELVVDLLDADERALVFTQYREMGDLLQRHLAEQLDLRVPFLHGGVPKSRRDRMVDHFQDGTGSPLLIVSLKAGGTGLNLTAATRVVHYDRWWNPAVEDQATDRAWRIGQHRSVFVHKLVCQGTVEERISELIDDKRRLAGMVDRRHRRGVALRAVDRPAARARRARGRGRGGAAMSAAEQIVASAMSAAEPGALASAMLAASVAGRADPARFGRGRSYVRRRRSDRSLGRAGRADRVGPRIAIQPVPGAASGCRGFPLRTRMAMARLSAS